jgi:hypothetical protein
MRRSYDDSGRKHAGTGTADARSGLYDSEIVFDRLNPHWEDLVAKEPKTSPRGRDARTGHFTTVKKAREHPSTHVVERVPKPGYGDTKKK